MHEPLLRRLLVPALAQNQWGQAPSAFRWRRGRDSNPRYPCGYNTLAVCRFRPLSHLSVARPGGIEPPTCRSVADRSNPLSYGRK